MMRVMEKRATPFTGMAEGQKIQGGRGEGTVNGVAIEGHSSKKVLMLSGP